MPRLKPEETTDFSFGMLEGAAATAFPRTAVALALNARIRPDGTLERRGGYGKTHASALASAVGYGGVAFRTAGGNDQIVVVIGSTAFMSDDDGATWTSVATGLRADYWTWAKMRVGATNYLYGANGAGTVARWDGSTWDTNPNAPSGVKYVAAFNGRLWYAGHAGIQVQGTKIADPSVIASPDGALIQALAADTADLFGLLAVGPHLLIFNRGSTSYLDGYGEQTMVVATGDIGISGSVGCVAFRTACLVGDQEACWLSERGIEHYRVGAGLTLVSNAIDPTMQSLNFDFLHDSPGVPCAAWDATHQDLIVPVSTLGTRNDRSIVINLRKNVQYQRPGPQASITVDQQQGQSTAGEVFFSVDASGYIQNDATGYEAGVDDRGYIEPALSGGSGYAGYVDSDGYIDTFTDDSLPATVFVYKRKLYSLSYDGFVRLHNDNDNDNEASDAAGGVNVAMRVRSRPYLFNAARNRKRARYAWFSLRTNAAATVQVSAVSAKTVGSPKTAIVAPSTSLAGRRDRTSVSGLGDAPQVEFVTTDRVKLVMLGMDANVLREGW